MVLIVLEMYHKIYYDTSTIKVKGVWSMEEKFCSKCGEWKAFSEFNKNRAKKDGYHNYCKKCRKVYDTERYHKNKTCNDRKVVIRTEEGKTCTKCEEWKPYNKFTKLSRNKDGYYSHCKDCRKAYQKANKEMIAEKKKIYYNENKSNEDRKVFINTISNGGKVCSKCEEWNSYDEFKKKKDTKDGYDSWCKKCVAKYRKIKSKEISEYQKRYFAELPKEEKERMKANSKIYHQNYYENNKDKYYMYRVKRRSNKNNVRFTPFQRKKIIERDKWKCQNCGCKVHNRSTGNWNTPDKAHIDHIIPISKGGNSEPSNLQTLCRTCNLSKQDKVETQLSLF
jgi:5-methylcytosine-specific restriction endonuclease McrA